MFYKLGNFEDSGDGGSWWGGGTLERYYPSLKRLLPILFSLPIVFSSLLRNRRDAKEHSTENGSFLFEDLSTTMALTQGCEEGIPTHPYPQHMQTVRCFSHGQSIISCEK